MSSLKRRLLTGVAAGLVVSACGDTDITEPGSISLSLTTTSATVVQGGSQAVAATLTRAGGFTGTVNLTVTGSPLPTGVTPVVSNVVNTGLVTTATVTINVDAATATGIYALVVHGTGSGVTEATKTFTLTVTAAGSFTLGMTPAGGVTMVQGSTDASKTITITRTNYTPTILLSAEGLPTGVTATFAGNPVSGNSSVMTLTASATATVTTGSVVVTVRGTGPAALRYPGPEANVEATVTFNLTITAAPAGNFTLTTTPPTSVPVTQGGNANVTVNINRTGGNTSNVALTFTGTLPAGMNVTFLPTSTTGNSSVLTVTTTAATTVGTTSIVIKGNATSLGEQTIGLDIIVTATSGSGNVTLNFSTCPADERPANGWVAFQDGTAGVWTRATQAPAYVYQFNITQSKGGIAWVEFGWGSVVNVRYYTQAELTAFTGATLCPPDVPGTGRTVTGGAANITTGATTAYASYGEGTVFTLANGVPFQLDNVNNGSNDLVGFMQVGATPSSSTDRGFIDRGLNPVANPGSVGTVDFAPANPKSFPLQVATLNVGVGAEVGETIFQSGMAFYSGTGANACTRAAFGVPGQITGTSFPASGVPIGNQVATDIHSIFINASGGGGLRSMGEDFKNITTRAATPFVLPTVPAVTPTILAGPYKRLQATTTFAAELNSFATLGYSNGDLVQQVSLFASAGWIGGTALTLTTPDFSTTVGGGFDNTWAPGSTDPVTWVLWRSGETGTVCTEGHRVVSAGRVGTI